MEVTEFQIKLFFWVLTFFGTVLTMAISAVVVFLYRLSVTTNSLNNKIGIVITNRDNDHELILKIDGRVTKIEDASKKDVSNK